MRKIILAITLFVAVLSFTTRAFADTIQTTEVSNSQSPYPPPEILPTVTNTSTDFLISTPYPEPVEGPVASPVLQISPFDVTEFDYSIYLPIIFKSYNRVGAIDYADNWAHDRNSNYPNYGTGCDECNDCTDYVSQILYTGGLPLRTGNWNPNSVFEWWYRKILFWFENSLTWSATPEFISYLFQYPNDFEFRSWPTELKGGDFFVMDLRGATPQDPPNGIPDHVRFVVGYGWTSTDEIDYQCGSIPPTIPPSTYALLIDQHCVDRRHVIWNFNVPSGVGYWPFHVK